MMDSPEIIHARSVRFVESLDKLGRGIIGIATMLSIIDEEETKANLPADKENFFESTRGLAHKINNGRKS